MKRPPCDPECAGRCPGCHDHCKIYKDWKAEVEKEKAFLRQGRESTIADHAIRKIWRGMRYGSKKGVFSSGK